MGDALHQARQKRQNSILSARWDLFHQKSWRQANLLARHHRHPGPRFAVSRGAARESSPRRQPWVCETNGSSSVRAIENYLRNDGSFAPSGAYDQPNRYPRPMPWANIFRASGALKMPPPPNFSRHYLICDTFLLWFIMRFLDERIQVSGIVLAGG